RAPSDAGACVACGLVRRLSRRLRASRRWPSARAGAFPSGGRGGRRLRARDCRLCLAAMAQELRSVYLIGGSDRPKVELAVARLGGHFAPAAVETLSGVDATGADGVAACNALGLFGSGHRLVLVQDVDRWKADDAKAIAEYAQAPAPDTVLALVAEELRKD